ncbi:hypothetical protein CF386_07645 [Paraphotobacterium marinum]|uniref:Endonuclease/exonuclease/phosphatase domain-containing protein n=1 Tax=Paraphotobacterium marinum TaxID=1755811 RepID=A0A220VG53_9GAMM|nr:hypothetical protein [Paraphotobacterium marinum]ASK78933.1 hypothetical protein CF386_07645 [Paraphotobacterium marinum]
MKKFIVNKIAVVLINFIFISFNVLANTDIGVIQYNVKGDTRSSHSGGVWTKPNLRDKQRQLIQDKVDSNDVDFIALEQAVTDTTSGANPLLNTLLLGKKWITISNSEHFSNDFDEAQLTYDSDKWTLISSHSDFWIKSDAEVRPYTMGYFHLKSDASVKVLVVALHFPHLSTPAWNLESFRDNVSKLVGSSDLSNVNVILIGDMNEASTEDNINNLAGFSEMFGKFSITKIAKTCCSNSDYVYNFDQVAVNNGGDFMSSEIINSSDPDIYIPKGAPTESAESHKAIYVQLTVN